MAEESDEGRDGTQQHGDNREIMQMLEMMAANCALCHDGNVKRK